VSSCVATSRSEDAGGAATSEGASARGGAGMNDDDRGFSPCTNHVADGGPLDCTRGRDRRERFFSTGRGVGRAGGGGAGLACFCTGAGAFRALSVSRAAGFGGFAAARFGAGAAFLATRFAAPLGRDGRATTFLMRRLRAFPAVFFPCAFAIVKKEWRSIAVSRFPVEGFHAISRRC